MLSGNCTEALSFQANVTISGSSANLIKNGIAPLPFPLPALLEQYWYIKRGERVKGEGTCSILCNIRVYGSRLLAYFGELALVYENFVRRRCPRFFLLRPNFSHDERYRRSRFQS